MDFPIKICKRLDSWIFFLIVLVGLVTWHCSQINKALAGDLSSDIWLVQYYMTQEHEGHPWVFLPPSYNAERFYLAYPLFYYLNPGLDHGLLNYRLFSLFLLVATYLATGLVVKKITRHWWWATLAGALFIIPHTIFPTNIGFIGFRNFRGLALVFPLYALLSYYWVTRGLHSSRQNILLALLAAGSVYLYPPFGVVIVPLVIITAFLVHRWLKWRAIAVFTLIYLIGSSLFWYGHFSNPASGMLDLEPNLSSADLRTQADILHYRIPDASLAGMDAGVIKRSLWDGLPLLVLMILSLVLYQPIKRSFDREEWRAYQFGLWFTLVLGLFIAAVEIINWYLAWQGRPPFFIEHWRLMRLMGFVWLIHGIMIVYYLGYYRQKQLLAGVITAVLILSPLAISASVVRLVVRTVIPEKIRLVYNLAPNVVSNDSLHFTHLAEVASWARQHLALSRAKIFVFSGGQEDFMFKVLSRCETNLTVKEGSIWVTSGLANSKKWYEERRHYDEVVKPNQDFDKIISWARELQASYLLLPRGEWSQLYQKTVAKPLRPVFGNIDYQLLKLD